MTPLQQDNTQIEQILTRICDESVAFLQNVAEMPASNTPPIIPPQTLPNAGIGTEATLQLFQEKYAGTLSGTAGPRYFGFVTGGATPASIAGDWLTSIYDQNAAGSGESSAPQLELEAIGFLRDLFGLPPAYTGTFVTGATMANFVGLALGRQWVGLQQGVDVAQVGLACLPPIRVLSGAPHASIYKAMAMLGMGRGQLAQIPTLPNREAVDVDALRQRLKEIDEPCIVVGNAGTVNSVDYDDLNALADLRHEFPFWLHVDGAFGGFAAYLPEKVGLIAGISRADSITIDAHKWLNVPYDCAMQFTRHHHLQAQVFQNSAVYLDQAPTTSSFVHLTPENSRRFRALPVWFTLLAYGRDGYRDLVANCCTIAQQFGDRIVASDQFRLLAPVSMNGVLFTFNQPNPTLPDIRTYLAQLQANGKAFLTPTLYQNTPAIRISVTNWRTTPADLDHAWQGMLSALAFNS